MRKRLEDDLRNIELQQNVNLFVFFFVPPFWSARSLTILKQRIDVDEVDRWARPPEENLEIYHNTGKNLSM